LASSDDPPSFDDFVVNLRDRLGTADAINASELHSFKTLMSDAEVIPEQWYQEAFDELEAQGHLDPASSKVMGDAVGRLSADGRLYLRSEAAEDF
jgi:hypothetical protein